MNTENNTSGVTFKIHNKEAGNKPLKLENTVVIDQVKEVIEQSKKFQPVQDNYLFNSTLIPKYLATVKLPEHYSRLDAHNLLKWLRSVFFIEENFTFHQGTMEESFIHKISSLHIRDLATTCIDFNLRPADIEMLALHCHTVFIENQWYKASKATASEAGELVEFVRKNKWLQEIVESYLKDFGEIEVINKSKTNNVSDTSPTGTSQIFNVAEEMRVDVNLTGV